MEQNTVTALNDRLVAQIGASVQNDAILEAFRFVPRHVFVPSFFNRASTNPRQTWQRISSSTNEQEWLEQVYSNRPLTTSIDEHGNPDMSSSQPDLMAQMLQSVRLQRGHRVLEIGTGTGYHAAILGCIAGRENVVTLDINERQLAVVRARIEKTIGSGVHVLHADGRHLPETLRNFDAIIVTGAHERIEPSWIDALAPGGRLVFNWSKSLTKVMIEVEKSQGGDGNSDTRLAGQVCAYGGDFMHLHDGSGVAPLILPSEPLELITSMEFRAQMEDPDVGFFLQIHKPSLHAHHYRNKRGDRSSAVKEGDRVIRFFPGKIRGDASLWDEISALYETYQQLLQPSRKAFSVTVDANGVMIFAYKERTFLVEIPAPPGAALPGEGMECLISDVR